MLYRLCDDVMARRATRHQSNGAELTIAPDEPVYGIGVVSQLVQLPIWTLRILDREGIVKPKRSRGRTRLYSLQDVQRLAHVRRLLVDEGVNMSGVRIILRMESHMIVTG